MVLPYQTSTVPLSNYLLNFALAQGFVLGCLKGVRLDSSDVGPHLRFIHPPPLSDISPGVGLEPHGKNMLNYQVIPCISGWSDHVRNGFTQSWEV